MNISENLQILNTAKRDIKAGIIEKGQEVGDNMHDYAEAIGNISSGVVDHTDYLCFEAIEDSAMSLSNYNGNTPNVEYSFDKTSWTTWDYDNIDIATGLKLYMRGENSIFNCDNYVAEGVTTKYSLFSTTGKLIVSGDLTTLLNKTGEPVDVVAYSFENLFKESFGIYKVASLKCSHKSLGRGGWAHNLFKGCTNIVYADIDLTVNAAKTYGSRVPGYMFAYAFSGCSKLAIFGRVLPDSNIASIYNAMFLYCNSLQYIRCEVITLLSDGSSQILAIVEGSTSVGILMLSKSATWTKPTSYWPRGWSLMKAVS